MKAKILWIEGKRADSPSFVPAMRKKGYQIEVVPTGDAALTHLQDFSPHLIILNAASLRSNGKRICQSLRKANGVVPIVIIGAADQVFTGDMSANLILSLPFTVRKLVNRIAPFVPGEGNSMLQAGPIRLDVERKKVVCEGREARLTPRLTHILQMLMQQPGAVLERGKLFREVWDTAYTGDTRTLDVHMSWLRQAIEENPREPRFIKTIRGVGYRLDV